MCPTHPLTAGSGRRVFKFNMASKWASQISHDFVSEKLETNEIVIIIATISFEIMKTIFLELNWIPNHMSHLF